MVTSGPAVLRSVNIFPVAKLDQIPCSSSATTFTEARVIDRGRPGGDRTSAGTIRAAILIRHVIVKRVSGGYLGNMNAGMRRFYISGKISKRGVKPLMILQSSLVLLIENLLSLFECCEVLCPLDNVQTHNSNVRHLATTHSGTHIRCSHQIYCFPNVDM